MKLAVVPGDGIGIGVGGVVHLNRGAGRQLHLFDTVHLHGAGGALQVGDLGGLCAGDRGGGGCAGDSHLHSVQLTDETYVGTVVSAHTTVE